MGQQQSDHVFWSQRIADHLLFNYEDTMGWPELQREAAELQAAWNAGQGTGYTPETAQLVDRTRNYQQRVRQHLQYAGISCKPELLTHMLEELDYYQGIMEQRLALEEEVNFWLEENRTALEYIICELKVNRGNTAEVLGLTAEASALIPALAELQLALRADTPVDAVIRTLQEIQRRLVPAQQRFRDLNRQLNLGLPDDRLHHEEQESQYAQQRLSRYRPGQQASPRRR